jgi:hypothetical protein
MKEVDKIIFLHVPKTAGTTISAQLINSFHENEIHQAKLNLEDLEKQIKNKKLIIGHSTLKYFSKIKNLDEFLIFTVLRDPIERAISWSLHALRLKRNNKNHSVSFLPDKNILPYIYYNLDKIDYTIFFDNFDSDLNYFSKNYFENLTLNPKLFLNTAGDNVDINFDEVRELNFNDRRKHKFINFQDYKYFLIKYKKDEIKMYNDIKKNSLKKKERINKKFIFLPPKFTTKLSWSANDIIISENCYYREKNQNMSWVWTGPDTVTNFYFNLVDGQYKFEVKIVNTISAEILSKITFLVNDQVIEAKKTLDQNSHFFFSGNALIKSSLNKKSKLTIKLPFTLKFNEVDKSSSDSRYVGVAIQNITFFKN